MVNGEWSKIKLVCGNHDDDMSHEMVLQQGREGMSVFYTCPCYHSPEKNGRKCNNRLNIVDYEKMMNLLYEESISDDGDSINLRGKTWSKKGIDYHVIEHDGTSFTVTVKNKKAMGQ